MPHGFQPTDRRVVAGPVESDAHNQVWLTIWALVADYSGNQCGLPAPDVLGVSLSF